MLPGECKAHTYLSQPTGFGIHALSNDAPDGLVLGKAGYLSSLREKALASVSAFILYYTYETFLKLFYRKG
jgi:hypothetical protein